jgi:hypothetical protein
MSSDAFMLPGLPQLPASGLKGTDPGAPAALKSNALADSSDSSESFSATLNRISEQQCGSEPEGKPAAKPAVTSKGSNTDSASPQKMSKTFDCPQDHLEEVETPLLKGGAPFFYPLSGFALMPSDLMSLSIAEDGSLAVEPPSGSTSGAGLLMLTNLIGHLYPQSGQIEGEKLGIGLFEQMQANVSPETTHRTIFDQLAFSNVSQQDGEGLSGNTARFFEFWQRMFSLTSTAPDGALNVQPEPSGINGNGNAVMNPLLQMLGVSGAVWSINPDASSSNGPITEGAHLTAALVDRLTALSELAQTGISENAKMAAAGHSNSEPVLELPGRQMTENSQSLDIQAAFKAADEPPANPKSTDEGITVKTPEEVLGIKSAFQKSEMLPAHELGSKISQIDGDSKDSSFLFAQDQMPQHLSRLENAATSSEAAQRSLMAQNMDQIVQKALLSFHNGQHEVQLHLKPEFLGQIRMQIISEGQQVAIKMVAELPFVKDMLENNLHQLKADLQSQGLDIDELEVSVAHDSHAERDVHQNAEAAKLQAGKSGTDSDDGSSEELGQAQHQDGGPLAETAIDYFA